MVMELLIWKHDKIKIDIFALFFGKSSFIKDLRNVFGALCIKLR
jgi:hypothetical protein